MNSGKFLNVAAFAIAVALSFGHSNGTAFEDHFLTIAGGYSPTGNQVSLEKNVLFFQRLLRDQELHGHSQDIFFADGFENGRSLQIKDASTVPLPNRLMAEFFGSTRNLGLNYRPHQIPDIRGGTTLENIRNWFRRDGQKMKAGDRLVLYVSAHGGSSKDKSKPHDTTIYLWNRQTIKVSELVELMDTLPDGVEIVTVMVQCHAGGFARIVFDQSDPENGASKQNRVGFFATIHSRPAAGCTPEIDEADYEEYSSYFWAAIAGQSRTGQAIDIPDYDNNGRVTFDEAHAYAVLTSNTIDLPIKTSGEFLRSKSSFGEDEDSELLGKNLPYSKVLELAGPIDRAILEGLSEQLKLGGENQIETARKEGSKRVSRSRSSRGSMSETVKLRRAIAADIRKKWPELGNVMNPLAIEMITKRADEFVKTVEGHRDYQKYRKLADKPKSGQLSATEQKVKFERFVRIAENVILAANLESSGNEDHLNAYHRIVASEAGLLNRE